jgi:hypothetical protein
MRSFDASKVFSGKLNWRLFCIFYSLIPAVLTICAQLFLEFLIGLAMGEYIFPKILGPMLKANSFGVVALYVFIGILLISWLAFHYFFGYLYVNLLSKPGGSKRALLARTLAIVTCIFWAPLMLFHVVMGFGFGPWFSAAFISADLLFILGMILSLRSIRKQSQAIQS